MNTSNPLDSDQEFLIYTEVTENPPEATDEEIEEYAKRIGIDVETEPHLLFLAKEGINHNLPEPWKPCLNKTRDVVFYLNEETQQTQWEHPMDSVYRDRVVQARAELALNRIQNFDPLTKRPPNKDLPPIKRSGGGLAPINPVAGSLGKLGSFASAPSDLRQRTPPRSFLNNDLSNSLFNNSKNNNNNNRNSNPPLGRLSSTESNIISGSSLNSFKDTDDEEESTPSLVRPQPLKKLGGLTITGGGANFLKGTKPTEAPPKVTRLGALSSSGKQDQQEISNELESGGGGDNSDKKPIKSILVNSISRCRPKNPTDNIYELDGFSMNLDDMTEDEKQVLSQLDSSTASKAKGNVKFNLDENTELKFEMDDDEDEEQIVEDIDTERTDGEESISNRPNIRQDKPLQQTQIHNGSGDSFQTRNAQWSPISEKEGPIIPQRRNEIPFIPEYSDADIAAMKKAMKDEMENELKKFKDQLEEERKSRQEQIQKHLEETVAQFKLEKDETIRRIRKDMDNEKLLEIERAKREIEVLLQKEVDEMKTNFDETLQQRRMELEDEHLKRIDELTAEFRKKEEDKVSEILTRKSSEENLKQIEEDLKKQKETLREEHKKQISQIKDYHKVILDKVKADLEVEEEKVRQDHTRRRAEMIAKFEQETEDLKKKLIKSQEDALKKIKDEFEVSKAALEKSLKSSLQEVKDKINTQHRSASETNLNERTGEDELNALKLKYQQLESKYKAMRLELQQLTQEMSPAKNRNDSAISVSTSGKSKSKKRNEPNNPVSARTDRPSPKKILNKSLSARNESLEATATDSAHCSESNTDTNSSHYPSSDGLGSKLRGSKAKGDENSPEEDYDNDSSSETNRINSALQALEILKQEIMELKMGKVKRHHHHHSNNNTQHHQDTPESEHKPLPALNNQKVSTSSKRSSTGDGSHSARKKSSGGTTTSSKPKSSKSARSKVSLLSPPTHDISTDTNNIPSSSPPPYPKFISRSVSVIPQDLSGPKSEPASDDPHQRIVEDAKAFIRMQKNRLKDPSPIPDSTHLILPTAKNNLLLFDEKLLKSVSPRRPTSIHMDLVSETESSGVSSLKDHRSSERKKLSKDIDEICNSLNNLDQQMKLVWSVVKEKQQLQNQQAQPFLVQDESLSFLNASSSRTATDLTSLLPNTVPLLLGKTTPRICASLPTSARRPLVPPTSPTNSPAGNSTNLGASVASIDLTNADLAMSLNAGPRYSSLLSNNQSSSSQTVLDALRMSGLSTTRLDCTDLLKSLEDELKEFKTTKQKLLEKGPPKGTNSLDRRNSLSKQNNQTSNILEKTKDLQEWLKKY